MRWCFFLLAAASLVWVHWPLALSFSAVAAMCYFSLRHTHVWAIARREWQSLIGSPLGYLVLCCFGVLLWYLYAAAVGRLLHMPRLSPLTLSPLAALFHGETMSVAMLLLIPTVTMKLLAEEKQSGTQELFLTYPLPEWQWIVGKFFGVWLYYCLLWLPSLWPVWLLSRIGGIDIGQVVAVYVTLATCGAGLLAVGIAVSSLFASQLAAFMVTLACLLPFASAFFLSPATLPEPLAFLSLHNHLERACRGCLDSRTLVLFATLALLGLGLASRVVAARRWFPLTWPRLSRRRRLAVTASLAISFAAAFFIIWQWQPGLKTFLAAALLLALAIIAGVVLSGPQANPGFRLAGNVATGTLAWLTAFVAVNYLAACYHMRLDISSSRAFTLPAATVKLLRQEIPHGDQVKVVALVGWSDQGYHEHIERDNERYFLLGEAFRKLAESLNRPGDERFAYEFLHPAQVRSNQPVADYLREERADRQRLAELQNRYGVVGYRELLFFYRDRHYIVSDGELFSRKLEASQLPRLLVLWRKIYESGGISEPPPDDPDKSFARLQEIANAEMLSIFAGDRFEQVLVNAVLRVVRGTPWRIYFSQGQGEKWVSGNLTNDYQTAYRLATRTMRGNFQVRTLDLGNTVRIPDDCDLLVIPGTQADTRLPIAAIGAIDAYLAHGGTLVAMLAAESDAGLGELLARHGIHTEAGLATQYHLAGQERRMQKIATVSIDMTGLLPLDTVIRRHMERDNAEAMPYFLHRARLVEPMSPLPAGIEACGLLPVSPRVFADALDDDQQTADRKPRSGPYTLAALARASGRPGWQVAVIGNMIFASDTPFYPSGGEQPIPYFMLGSNRFLLPALFEYLRKPVPEVTVDAVEPVRFAARTMSRRQLDLYSWSHGVLCLLLALAGIRVWRRQRA